jgi:hypothetical protein
MKISNIHFRDNILPYILVPLIIIINIVSYYRFMVKHDYVVGYQGSCDPVTGKCFKSCDDDACIKVDYYSEMQKYEPDLYRECGKDITDCEAANTCLPGDHKCSITYCNKETSDHDNACQDPLGSQSDTQINSINNTSNQNI